MTRSRGRALAVDGGRLALGIVAAGVAVRMQLDPDLWGHLRFGLDLLETGQLTSRDPYSFTQDVAWINHEWLSELALAAAYRVAEVPGVLTLKLAVLGAALAAVVAWTRDLRPELRGWLGAAAFLGLFPIAATHRPQLWTILGVALLCAILARRLRLLWMPLVFAAWANLHGGWIVGAGIAGLWILGRWLDTRRVADVLPAAGALAVSLAATLANPYGPKLWGFLLATVRMSRPDITEWRPYWESFGPEHLVLWPLSAAILGAALATRWQALRWASLLPALWLMASGLWVYRLAPLGGLLVLFCARDAWRREDAAEAGPVEPHTTRLARRGIELAVVAAFSIPFLVAQSRCLPLAEEWAPDRIAAGALAAPDVKGRLLVPFDWGEYAIWHWGGKLRVSIDGRRETIYSQDALQRHSAILSGSAEGLAELERMRPDYAWLPGTPEESPLTPWLLAGGYRIDVRTERSFIAARSELPALRPGTPLSACFP